MAAPVSAVHKALSPNSFRPLKLFHNLFLTFCNLHELRVKLKKYFCPSPTYFKLR